MKRNKTRSINIQRNAFMRGVLLIANGRKSELRIGNDWVWALIVAAGATAIVGACFATGVCEAAALITLLGEGVAAIVIEIMEAAGVGVAAAA